MPATIKDELLCRQSGCKNKAEYIVYWPAQETRQCEEHKDKLLALGKVMGIRVPAVPILKE